MLIPEAAKQTASCALQLAALRTTHLWMMHKQKVAWEQKSENCMHCYRRNCGTSKCKNSSNTQGQGHTQRDWKITQYGAQINKETKKKNGVCVCTA